MVKIDEFFSMTSRSGSNKENQDRRSRSKIKRESEVIDLDLDDDDLNDLVSNSVNLEEKSRPISIKDNDKSSLKRTKTEHMDVKPKKQKLGETIRQNEEHAAEKSLEEVLASIPSVDLDAVTTKTVTPFGWKTNEADDGTMSGGAGMDIPEGRPNCLLGLTIVFTGTLPNLDRTASENLAKKYGARVTKSISKKTSVVVLGDEAGPKKLETIKKLGIKAIDEGGFKQLISGMPAEGGDNEAAERARKKLKEQEDQALREAQAMQEQEDKKELKRKLALQSGKPVTSGSLVSGDGQLWTTKYAPTSLQQLCGNKAAVAKLKGWLQSWDSSTKPALKAVMLSGPPGIGKTTAAHLIAEELGYDVLETNASDVRSKSLLNSGIKYALDSNSVVGMVKSAIGDDQGLNGKKFVIIMDEVDGMSGGDRGGVGQMAQFCRKTKTPMILICNERNLPKMRPFDRVVLDIPFRRPDAQAVKARLMTIAMREKFKLDPNVIDRLVAVTRGDIRQMINLLSTVTKTTKTIGSENIHQLSGNWEKNVALKVFDIVPKLLNGNIYTEAGCKHFPLYKKMELYFDDFDFTPLMVQENYVSTRPSFLKTGQTHLSAVAEAAESISEGDLVDKKIRSAEQLWSLLPLHAVLSTVRPSSKVAGNVTQRINFTSFLGQNSKMGKYYRLLQDIHYHSRLSTSTNKVGLRTQYMPTMRKRLLNPILAGEQGIQEIIKFLDKYYLSKEHWDAIMEFYVGTEKTDTVLKKIPAKVKSAFTRAYNSSSHPTPIMKVGTSAVKESAASRPDYEDVVDKDDEVPVEEELPKDEDAIDFKKDKFIKQMKQKTSKSTNSGRKKGKKKL